MNVREQEKMLKSSLEQMAAFSPSLPEHTEKPHTNQALKCPRCDSLNTKFCYYNNYSPTQPRHFCKNCKRYWTIGGILRNVPVGGGCRKDKRSKQRNAQHGAVKSSDTLSRSTISGENSSGTRGSIYSNAAGSPDTLLPANGRGNCATSGCLKLPVDEPGNVNLPPSNAVNATITDKSKATCPSSAESSNLSLLLSSSKANSMLSRDEFLDSVLLGFTIPNITSFENLDSDHFNGGCSSLEKIPHHLTATAGQKSETEGIIASSCMQGVDSPNCVNFSSLQCMPQQQYQEVRESIAQDSRQEQTSSWRMLMEDSLCGYRRTLSDAEGFSNGSLDWQLLPEGLFDPPASVCYMNGHL